jgi:hypothetical protein
MNTYTAVDRTPYTYVVTHLPSGKKYYGSRYAKHCSPSDLWKTYFTSSRSVKHLIDRDGIKSFVVSIRKIFASVSSCRRWEHRFLHKVDAKNNDRWINDHNGGSKFYNTSSASISTKQKMSRVRLGKPKSESMKFNSMWYYELRFDNGAVEYIKGKVNVLERLSRKDWESIRTTIQRKNGYLRRNKVTIRRMPKSFQAQ